MDYISLIKGCKSAEDLYLLLEKINAHLAMVRDVSMEAYQDAIFYRLRVIAQIQWLEKVGVFLNDINAVNN